MILLDTNIFSELMRPAVADPVKAWIRERPLVDLFTTAITVAEILRGIRRLPRGRRRTGLQERFDALLDLGFRDRVLAFDQEAADAYASIVTGRIQTGSPIGIFDAMIAGIALSRGADIATRDVRGFDGVGVTIINPWDR